MTASDINLDFERASRIGFDEAILCEGKSVEQLTCILDQAGNQGFPLLLTRLAPAVFEQLENTHKVAIDYDPVSRTGFFGTRRPQRTCEARIAVVTAGTSDVPVGREAARTLRYLGEDVLEVCDVGVAGLWRLLDRIEEIRQKPVVIVAAGMDGALPSVVCGLVPGLVIAVPTSVGYGVSDGGRTALHAALASCASGLLTVNIDNGYGAACAAWRVLSASDLIGRTNESASQPAAEVGGGLKRTKTKKDV